MSPVLIECKAKRPAGTIVEFDAPNAIDGKILYHFKDDGFGRHVAPVSNEDHIARFLSIPEGFRLVTSAAHEPAEPVAPAAIVTPSALGGVIAPGAVTEPAAATATAPEGHDADAQNLEALRAEYFDVTGTPARYNAKPETLKAQIEAFKANQAAG